MMTLKQFRVQNFRSVMDSGWIDCDEITSLIGINEAGKSNILLALWKLNPARTEGESRIDALHDTPRHMYTQWENIPEQITFVSAKFTLDDALRNKVVSLNGCEESAAQTVEISRRYDKKYLVSFPKFSQNDTIQAKTIFNIVDVVKKEITALTEKTKAEAGIKDKVIDTLDKIITYTTGKETLTSADLKALTTIYPSSIHKSATSEIYPKYEMLKTTIANEFALLKSKNPSRNEETHKLMLAEMPSFVYYSNYGNLDVEITCLIPSSC